MQIYLFLFRISISVRVVLFQLFFEMYRCWIVSYWILRISRLIIRKISIKDIRIVIEYTFVFPIVKLNLRISHKTKIDWVDIISFCSVSARFSLDISFRLFSTHSISQNYFSSNEKQVSLLTKWILVRLIATS